MALHGNVHEKGQLRVVVHEGGRDSHLSDEHFETVCSVAVVNHDNVVAAAVGGGDGFQHMACVRRNADCCSRALRCALTVCAHAAIVHICHGNHILGAAC